jgi:hypothetical protein
VTLPWLLKRRGSSSETAPHPHHSAQKRAVHPPGSRMNASWTRLHGLNLLRGVGAGLKMRAEFGRKQLQLWWDGPPSRQTKAGVQRDALKLAGGQQILALQEPRSQRLAVRGHCYDARRKGSEGVLVIGWMRGTDHAFRCASAYPRRETSAGQQRRTAHHPFPERRRIRHRLKRRMTRAKRPSFSGLSEVGCRIRGFNPFRGGGKNDKHFQISLRRALVNFDLGVVVRKSVSARKGVNRELFTLLGFAISVLTL